MVSVRFAPSPTGSLHLGSALSAVANRRFAEEHGGTMLLRIAETDGARNAGGGGVRVGGGPGAPPNVGGGAAAMAADLEGRGVGGDDGPVRQSDGAARHREAAETIGE